MFKALLLTKSDAGAPHCAVTELDDAQLPAGEVLVQVSHSTLNYKDGLAITGQAPVVRTWPMVPGIDFAGTVLESSDARYRVGDGVVLNGWGVGEAHWGGLAQKARVKADWLVPLPAGMAHMPRSRFLIFTFAGSAVWNAALIAGGYVLGSRFGTLDVWIGWAGAALTALLVGWYLYRVVTWKPHARR